ncbi:MAG TPA: ABC transporter permease [Gemmatimonadaceae bacterium]|nr:ABC transporter permease [Gemmatimonadaceae bacterium]
MRFAIDLLLRLYPASFRREYGDEMRALYLQRLAAAGSAAGRFAVFTEELMGTCAGAAAAHGDILRHDVRAAVRAFAHAPGFAFTAVAVTAIGIGANAAAFSVADVVLIRPLPFARPNELVRLWEAPNGAAGLEASPPNWRDWRAMSTSFTAVEAFHAWDVNVVGGSEPQRLEGAVVTPGLMAMLGVPPALGRTLMPTGPADGDVGAIVIADDLWRTMFGADSGVIGHVIQLDGAPHTVIGVMPPTFRFPDRDAQFWLAMPVAEQQIADRTDNWFDVIARLKPGVSIGQASADMRRVGAQLEAAYPQENRNVGVVVRSLRDEMSRESRLLLLGLCGAALCVLLIACANLTSLLLARSLTRRRELAVRAALGAGWERLARQLVTETVLLTGIGGAAGVGIAYAGLPLLARLVPLALPVADVPAIDGRILVFTMIATVLTGLGVGVVPALRASSEAPVSALREGTRGGGGRRQRLRSALVVTEVAASVVLLASAGLLLRALARVQAVDPGFRADHALTMRTALPRPEFDVAARRQRFYDDVIAGVEAVPGVQRAAYISFLPMVMGGGIWPVVRAGEPAVRTPGNTASLRYATPHIFDALGVPVIKGRGIDAADDATRPLVAVVSESFVKRFSPGADPIGMRFSFGLAERTIVGVVRDVKTRGLERESEPQVYLPAAQQPDSALVGYQPKDLVIRTTVPPASVTDAVRAVIGRIAPRQPVSAVQTLDAIVASNTASRTAQVRVLGAFAAIAFLLAAIGIHGLLAYTVSQRAHEFGVRMALGARQGEVVRLVLRHGSSLAAAGVVPGVAVAWAAGRWMQSLLFGLNPADAGTFGAVVALCVVMTLVGCLAPVLRAVRVPPASVFRGD